MRNQNPFYGLLKESRDLAKEWGVATVFKNKRRKITKRFLMSYQKMGVFQSQCVMLLLISQTKQRFQNLYDLTKMFEVLQPDKLLLFSNDIIKKEAGKLTSKYRAFK
jgi:hypothetical protein